MSMPESCELSGRVFGWVDGKGDASHQGEKAWEEMNLILIGGEMTYLLIINSIFDILRKIEG